MMEKTDKSNIEQWRNCVAIDHIEVNAIIGVYGHERQTPQPLLIDVAMAFDTQPAALTERLDRTIDYAYFAKIVRFVVENGRFLLLETVAEVVARLALLPPTTSEARAVTQAVRVVVRKPRALAHAVPSIAIERQDPPDDDVLLKTERCHVQRFKYDEDGVFHAPQNGWMFVLDGSCQFHDEAQTRGAIVVLRAQQQLHVSAGAFLWLSVDAAV